VIRVDPNGRWKRIAVHAKPGGSAIIPAAGDRLVRSGDGTPDSGSAGMREGGTRFAFAGARPSPARSGGGPTGARARPGAPGPPRRGGRHARAPRLRRAPPAGMSPGVEGWEMEDGGGSGMTGEHDDRRSWSIATQPAWGTADTAGGQ